MMSSPRTAVTRLRHDRFLVSLVLATVVAAGFFACDIGGATVQVVTAWAFVAGMHVCLAVAGRSLSRTPGLSSSARRFWRAVAVAGVIHLAGDLAQVVTAALDPLDPAAATGGPVQLAALSLGSAWLGLALLMSPLGFGSRRERMRFWMDVATVMVAAVVVGAMVSTLLVVLRQVAAFSDNERLLAELDSKVRELHLAQDGLRRSLAERDTLAARLRHQAFHDGLTGLPNRSLFLERLDGALTSSADTGGQVVVMLIDLDDFKLVNDAWGHGAGDALLREVAGRLTGCVRSADTVARLGGDEFAVLIEPLPGDDPTEIAARIVLAVQQPVAVEDGSARVGASVGIAVHDGSSIVEPLDAEALLREADHAMYAVKRDGKGSYAVALTTPTPDL